MRLWLADEVFAEFFAVTAVSASIVPDIDNQIRTGFIIDRMLI